METAVRHYAGDRVDASRVENGRVRLNGVAPGLFAVMCYEPAGCARDGGKDARTIVINAFATRKQAEDLVAYEKHYGSFRKPVPFDYYILETI